MGGCFSKCSGKKQATEVFDLSSLTASDSDAKSIEEPKPVRRHFLLKNLGKLVGKSNKDERNAKRNRWVSDDDGNPRATVECSVKTINVSVVPDNSDQESTEKGEKSSINESDSSQPLVPERTVNANIRSLKLLSERNAENDLEIVDVGSDEESGMSMDTCDLLASSTSEDSDDDEFLVRPMTAHQKRLNKKHGREAAAFENISAAVEAEMTNNTEVDDDNIKVVQVAPDGPKIKVINVRPKSPGECAMIEFVPQPAKTAGRKLTLSKPKEQMVPRLSEILPLDDDLSEGEIPMNVAFTFGEETDSDTDSDDVASSAPGPAGGALDPDASSRGKEKKKRPVKIYPYTKGRFVPQPPNPEEMFLLSFPEPVVEKSQRKDKNLEEFENRLLHPSEKARATEGKLLDGTLITWPKYIKGREKSGQDGGKQTGPHRSKMAWGGETSPKSSPVPALRASSQFFEAGQTTDQHVSPLGFAKHSGHKYGHKANTSSKPKLFTYKPKAAVLFERRNAVPFFKEKMLSFSPSPPPESSGEDETFSFTPEDLRRYARKRREKLERRPKTPFHGKKGMVSNAAEPRAEHQAEQSKPRPSAEPKTKEDQSSTLIYTLGPDGSCKRSEPKSVSFEIPLEGTKVRPPTSRPNSRRQLRPKTPRIDAGEIALNQANAQKRREDATRSRARGLGKRNQDPGTSRKELEHAKAQELMGKMDEKTKKHGENRKKQLENIVAKQAGHSVRFEKQKDVRFSHKQLTATEPAVSSATIPNYNVVDLVEIDRFFEDMDKE